MTNVLTAPPIERFRTSVCVAFVGLLLELFGGAWDISWHVDQGRETFWSPPHLVLYSGIILVLTSIFLAIMRVGGFRAARRYPALVAVVAATVFQLSSAPFDEWWHRMYGIDVTVWSPPHLVLILGGATTAVAIAALALQGRPSRFDRWLAAALFAVTLAAATAVVAEWEYPNIPRTHESQRRPSWNYPLAVSVTGGAVLVAAARSLGPGSATATGAGAVALKLGLTALLIGRNSPPLPPPFYLAPALAVEAVFFALGKLRLRPGFWAAALAGLVSAGVYLLAEPIWRSFVPGWPRLIPALAAFWPAVLAGGTLGGILGYGISLVFLRTVAADAQAPAPDQAPVLTPSPELGRRLG